MKIVIDKDIPFIQGRLEKVAEVYYCQGDKISEETIKDADALIIRTRTKCDSNLLKNSKVKLIATATIGTDHIDIPWCESNGIRVTSAPGCNAPGVAQYVFSSLFKTGFEAAAHTLGIIGYGNVGGIVGAWAHEMGITTLICDPLRREAGYRDVSYVEIEELLKNSDAVTLHVPMVKSGLYPTYHLIGERELGIMRNNSILINSSRGGVVDEEALLAHLRNNRIKSVTDVWVNEPAINRDLLSYSAIATPHIAGYSYEGKIRGTRMALEGVERFLGIQPDYSGLDLYENPGLKISEELIASSYNPSEDTEILKKLPENFENIRNGYKFRHEPLFSTMAQI